MLSREIDLSTICEIMGCVWETVKIGTIVVQVSVEGSILWAETGGRRKVLGGATRSAGPERCVRVKGTN